MSSAIVQDQPSLVETESVESDLSDVPLQSDLLREAKSVHVVRTVTFDEEDTTCSSVDSGTTSTTTPSVELDPSSQDEAFIRFKAVAATRIGEYMSSSSDDDDSLADFQQWSLDDFELVQKLGQGGVATVYEAQEKISGYHVALKAQKTEDYLADGEIDIHESLRHENIVKFYDYFYSDSFFGKMAVPKEKDSYALPGRRYVYTILELCRRGSLYDIITRQPKGRLTDEAQAAAWIKSAMVAIQHMHSLGILHCDVKTANFVLSGSGLLKVTDFGFSQRQGEGVDKEVEGGSLLYMAPEHLIAWRDEQMTSDLQTGVDVYGLGAVLFELLVGELPYVILEEVEEGLSLEEAVEDLVSCWDDCEFKPHVTVLHSLNAETELPTPNFPEYISAEAQDLLRCLLHSSPRERISLEDALSHPWIEKFAA